MPLPKCSNKKVIKKNIMETIRSGYKQKQASASTLSKASKTFRKSNQRGR